MVKKTGRRKRSSWKKISLCCLVAILFSAVAYVQLPGATTTAAGYPHNVVSNNIDCTACHTSEAATAGNVITAGTPPTVDGQCLTCHNEVLAPFEETHSSQNTSSSHGTWTVSCVTCHDPHNQDQVITYGSNSYLFTNASTSVTSGTEYSWIIYSGAGWTDHQWAGMLVVGNTASSPQVFHKIYDNTSDTLTIEGPITDAVTGNTFAIVYGGLINNTINYTKTNVTPNVPISGPTILLNNSGPNSFTNNNGASFTPPVLGAEGICIICHTLTTHQTNAGDSGHYNGQDCIVCHSHEGGFGKYAYATEALGSAGGSGFQFNSNQAWRPSIDPIKAMNSSNAAYTKVGGLGTCSGVYCHSNGAVGTLIGGPADNTNLAYATTPAWQGGSFGANRCGSCHDNPPQYSGQSHYNASGFMNKEGGHLVGIHFDNIFNGTSGLLTPGATDPSSHGASATSTTITCYLCHNGEIDSVQIDTYALNNLGGSSNMKCSACHTGDPIVPLQTGVIIDKSKHVNGQKDVVLANNFTVKSKAQLMTSSIPAGWTRNVGYKTAGAYDNATMTTADWNSNGKTCTTACHNSQPVTWGSSITCVSCHTALP